jgi:hypothetical protein
MNHTCQHCGELIVGDAWLRVLDTVVCSLCFMEATRLHLHAEKSMLEANRLQLETGGVTIRDSTINSTLEPLNAGFQCC